MRVQEPFKMLVEIAQRQGWKIEFSKGQHLKWTNPEGRVVISSSTTKNSKRSYMNARSELRKKGLQV